MAPRVFVGSEVTALADGADYPLPAAAARHAAQALRMRVGEPLTLFTGNGGEYATTIARIGRRDVIVHVERHEAIERESPVAVTLVVSLIAADMMDFVVRKAVELGAFAIAPVQSARSQRVASERVARRAAHWHQIAIAACEQCGRNRVPPILPVVPFAEWIESAAAGDRVAILDVDAKRSLSAVCSEAAPRSIVVGPEGGFAPEELARASARGAVRARLGGRVLRAETAALAALATVNAIAGDAR